MQVLSSQVPIEKGINFRDLGGINNLQGRVIRPQRLFRSGAFSEITQQDQQYLAEQIKIKYILDYRDSREIESHPDLIWHNSHYIHAPANPMSAQVTATLTDDHDDIQSQINQLLKMEQPAVFMQNLYKILPFQNSAYQKLVDLLLNTQGQSIVQHCAVGKDRTGVGVALTLFILDVDEQTIMADYLLTEQLLEEYRNKLLEHYATELNETQLASRREVFAAKPEYLQATFDAIKTKYQTIDNWLLHEYGIDHHKRSIIQNHYLD